MIDLQLTKIGEIDVSEVVVETLREGVCPNVEERRWWVYRELGIFSFSHELIVWKSNERWALKILSKLLLYTIRHAILWK